MSTQTGGDLNLTKPDLTDDHKVTIGTDLPANFQKIDDEVTAHLADTTSDDVHGLISEFYKKADVSYFTFAPVKNASKWYRIAESTNANQILNALIGFGTMVPSGASGTEAIFGITGAHIKKELIKIASVTHTYGITKVRIVHPTTAWTAGNYIDVYIANGDWNLKTHIQLLPLNATNSLNLVSTVVEDPEVPAGWTTTEVIL